MKNQNADGLRGIAAFGVAVGHFLTAFLPTMLHKNYPMIFPENTNPSVLFEVLTSPLVSIFYNGHFAVILFFVLSGYVLSLPYFSNESNFIEVLSKRLWGRYFRLNIPIAVAIFLSYVVYKSDFYFHLQASQISGSINWFKLFFAPEISFLTAAKEAIYESLLFGKGTLIPPLWTLKVEFIGSVYLLLFYMVKPKQSLFVPFLMALILIFILSGQDSIFYFAIFFGSLLGNLKDLGKYKIVFFAIGAYFGAFQFKSAAYDFLPTWNITGTDVWEVKSFYNTVGAILMTAPIVQGFGSKLFQSRAIQFLGRISFSIYLLHFIVLCSISSYLYVYFPQSKIFWIINFGFYVLICFVVSALFERFVDRKSIKLSHKFSETLFTK